MGTKKQPKEKTRKEKEDLALAELAEIRRAIVRLENIMACKHGHCYNTNILDQTR